MKTLIIYLELLILSMLISAQTDTQTKSTNEKFESKSFVTKFKDNMENAGLFAEFNYTGDYFSNVLGGLEKGSKYISNFQFAFDIELEKLLHIKNTTFHASFIGVEGNMPNDLVGSTQGISNIETANLFKLYDLWIENQPNESISILAGLFDVNSEFDTKYSSLLFINPSHGIGAEFGLTGKNGPSIYPNTSLGARINYKFGHDNYIKVGLFDAVPGTTENPYKPYFDFNFSDGLLMVSEFGYDCYYDYEYGSDGSNCLNFAVGVWYFTDKYQEVASTNFKRGNFGFYSFLESRLFILGNGAYLSGFMRNGMADPDVNSINFYFSGGLVLYNYFLEDDQLGLAIASTKNSNKQYEYLHLMNENPAHSEINIELTYLINISEYFSIQPDIQYFINPSLSNNVKNSLCFGLRTSFGL